MKIDRVYSVIYIYNLISAGRNLARKEKKTNGRCKYICVEHFRLLFSGPSTWCFPGMTRSVNYISDMPLFSLLNLSKTLYRVIIILKSTSLYSFFHSVLDLLVYGVEFSSLQTSSYRDLIQKERTHHYNVEYSWKYVDTIEEFKFVHMLEKFPLFPFWKF